MNAAKIYADATNPPSPIFKQDKPTDKEREMLKHQLAVAHKQWLSMNITQAVLQEIKRQRDKEEEELRKLSVSFIEPAKYYILKDRLQYKTVLDKVIDLFENPQQQETN